MEKKWKEIPVNKKTYDVVEFGSINVPGNICGSYQIGIQECNSNSAILRFRVDFTISYLARPQDYALHGSGETGLHNFTCEFAPRCLLDAPDYEPEDDYVHSYTAT